MDKILFTILLACNLHFVFAQRDDTMLENAIGREVTEAVIRRITATNIFRNDHVFLLRLAFLESDFGTVHNNSAIFRGGIWSVDEVLFRGTLESGLNLYHLKIKEQFGIDWTQVSWEHLRKPLYSGLAAALYFTRVNEPIPFRITDQAEHCRKWYRVLGDKNKFIEFAETLKNHSKCKGRLGLAIVLDSSESINQKDPTNYEKAKEFVAQLIESFELGRSTKIGMVVYSSNVQDVFPIKNELTNSEMATAARNAPYLNNGTRTDLAINRTVELFDQAFGGYEPIARLMLVITYGDSDPGSNLDAAVQAANAECIKSFAIGVGSSISRDELELIAMNNTRNVGVVEDFDSLQDYLHEITTFLCEQPTTLDMRFRYTYNPHIRISDRHLYTCEMDNDYVTIMFGTSYDLSITVYWSRTVKVPSAITHDGVLYGPDNNIYKFPGSSTWTDKIYFTISVEYDVYTFYSVDLFDELITVVPTSLAPETTSASPLPTLIPTETTSSTTPPPSCQPNPKFLKPLYGITLPSWPVAGTTVHLGMHANASEGDILSYKILTLGYEFLELTPENDILVTATIEEGAFVGPNNVLLLEVRAFVIGSEERYDDAIVAIVFPKGRVNHEEIV